MAGFEPTTFRMDQYFWRRKRQLRPLGHRPLYKNKWTNMRNVQANIYCSSHMKNSWWDLNLELLHLQSDVLSTELQYWGLLLFWCYNNHLKREVESKQKFYKHSVAENYFFFFIPNLKDVGSNPDTVKKLQNSVYTNMKYSHSSSVARVCAHAPTMEKSL